MVESNLRSRIAAELDSARPTRDLWPQVSKLALDSGRPRSFAPWATRRLAAFAVAAIAIAAGATIAAAVAANPPATHALLGPPPANARNGAIPPPLTAGDTTYTWTSVRTAPSTLEFTFKVSGGTATRMHSLVDTYENSNQPPPRDVAAQVAQLRAQSIVPKVTDASGAIMPVTFGLTFPAGAPLEGAAHVTIPGPGKYRVQFGDSGPAETISVS